MTIATGGFLHLHDTYEVEGVVADIPGLGTPPAVAAPPHACNLDDVDAELDVLVTSKIGLMLRSEPYGVDNADVNNTEFD